MMCRDEVTCMADSFQQLSVSGPRGLASHGRMLARKDIMLGFPGRGKWLFKASLWHESKHPDTHNNYTKVLLF